MLLLLLQPLTYGVRFYVYETPKEVEINCPDEVAVHTEFKCLGHVWGGNILNFMVDFGGDRRTIAIAGIQFDLKQIKESQGSRR